MNRILCILGFFLQSEAHAMFTNDSAKEINFKLVFVGPAGLGKIESLQYLYNQSDAASKGKMISMVNKTEKTAFFDLVPKGLGEIRG